LLRRFLYTCAAYLALPIVCLVMLWRGLRGNRSYWRDFRQRFGFGPAPSGPCLWVHAVSFGEVQAAATLVFALRKQYPNMPLLVTTGTPTGTDRALALFGREGVCVRYVPYDIPIFVRRFFNEVNPRIAIIFETELWPNLYFECRKRGVPLMLASARISPRSLTRYRWLGGLFRETLARGVIVAAQGEADAKRFRSMGADPARTFITGNIKFDFALPPDTVARGQAIRARQALDRHVWTAGSTHGGEETAVLKAHRIIRKAHPDALLFLVPRHSQRFSAVVEWLESENVRFARHSRGEVCTSETELLLVDTLGELLDFYAASDLAFVGGSLVKIGGHNLLEPAALSRPVLTGPNNFNSEDVAQLLVSRGAVRIVHGPQELAQQVIELMSDEALRARMGQTGRAAVDENRGSLGKLLELIGPLIGAQGAVEGGSGSVEASH
jgi:3-deoxy-D-manno-octulosonic-acid transferase